MVKENPQFQSIIISHIMQHLQFLASEISMQQMPPEMQERIQAISQQMQQVTPQEAQQMQMQIQMILDQFAAPVMAQLTQEFLQSIGQQSDEVDPLVAIRQRELDLKDKELEIDASQFDAKQQQRDQEKLLETELASQRLGIQKDIADDKLDVAMQRLDQQADLKLLELEQKFGRNL